MATRALIVQKEYALSDTLGQMMQLRLIQLMDSRNAPIVGSAIGSLVDALAWKDLLELLVIV
jgi:hypothetical protein